MSDSTSTQTAPALFSTFVISLASAAMIEMGLLDEPGANEEKKMNLPSAKQHIDILVMIKDKTLGNLDDDEKTLLERVVTDLKLQFSKLSEKPKQ